MIMSRTNDLQRSEHTLCKARAPVTDSVVLGALDPDHLYSPLRRRTGRRTRGFLPGSAVLEKLPHRPAAGIYPTRHRRVCLLRCRRAEVSFRCGPLAIHRVMLVVRPDDPHTELITGSRSTPRGFSLNEVEEPSYGHPAKTAAPFPRRSPREPHLQSVLTPDGLTSEA